ncbi:MAG: Phosphoglycolate phosphatase [Candidatus Thorarchaeota archaeon]|nr:MAG: Phosphoglycolate phosphatase [Candidatus Thorarchaeota archaeon]
MTDRIECSAVIFDFDGTLADSMPFLEGIGVDIMMKYFGVSEDDARQRYQSTTGLPYEQQIKMNFPNNPRNEEAIDKFESLKIDRIFEQELFPDTVDTLKKLDEMGIDIYVSSSTFQSTIKEYFDRRNLTHYFEEILGYRPGFEKGADHFNYVASKHNQPMKYTIFVGDSLKDYERSQGFCHFIGIVGMFSANEFRKRGHKGYLVDSLKQIPPLLQPKNT